jgi:hypothetical protein
MGGWAGTRGGGAIELVFLLGASGSTTVVELGDGGAELLELGWLDRMVAGRGGMAEGESNFRVEVMGGGGRDAVFFMGGGASRGFDGAIEIGGFGIVAAVSSVLGGAGGETGFSPLFSRAAAAMSGAAIAAPAAISFRRNDSPAGGVSGVAGAGGFAGTTETEGAGVAGVPEMGPDFALGGG